MQEPDAKTLPRVTSFKMGADIPEWLLVLNPIGPNATRKFWRFGCDIDVFETEDYFLLFPTSRLLATPRIFDDEGTFGNEATAAGKPVWIAQLRSVIFATHAETAQLAGSQWQKIGKPPVPTPTEPALQKTVEQAMAEWQARQQQVQTLPSGPDLRAALNAYQQGAASNEAARTAAPRPGLWRRLMTLLFS